MRFGPARGEDPAKQFREALSLGDRRGDMAAAGIETLDPAVAACRTLYAEQGLRAILGVILQTCRHRRPPTCVQSFEDRQV